MQTSRLAPTLIAVLVVAGMSVAQEAPPTKKVTLAEAIGFAKQSNGTIQAAAFSTKATRQGLHQTQATFWPTLSAGYSVAYSHNEQLTGATSKTSGSTRTPTLTAQWQPFDAGQKVNSLRQSELGVEIQEQNERDTRQRVELSVFSQYIEALRSQALLGVAKLQMDQAAEIEKQTRAQVDAGDAPEKDVFQAQAEVANAQTNYLVALDRVRTSRHQLLSLMGDGIEESELELVDLPWPAGKLGLSAAGVDVGEMAAESSENRGLWFQLREKAQPLQSASAKSFAELLQSRPDVASQTLQLKQANLQLERAKLDASLGFALSLSYTHAFGPDVLGRQGAALNLSVPLIDGSLGAKVKEAQMRLEAVRASEQQTVRSASAEVSSSARTFSIAFDRLEAAAKALIAAHKNYQAALAAQREGAEGTTVVTVLTALVSLTTAQVNLYQAKYDVLLGYQTFQRSQGADIDLRLWTP